MFLPKLCKELTMVNWQETPRIINDIARRRAVIVIGSGVSRHALGNDDNRPPTWKTFLEEALNNCPIKENIDHIKQAINEGDLLHACEWIKNRYDEDWTRHLRDTFSKPRFQPGKLHDEIARLDSRIIFSLNFDDIYERAAHQFYSGCIFIKNYYDEGVSECLRDDGRYIIKVHGSLNTPEKLIFTQQEYAKARVHNATFYQAFDSALMTHSFVFIGAGYSDPDVNLILENQAFGFPTSNPHYIITSSPNETDLKESLRKNRNLKTIEYDKVDDHHTGLVDAIKELADLVEEQRLKLNETNNW